MASNKNRVGGILFVKRQGRQLRVKGDWTVGFGTPKREAVTGSDGTHGYKETPQVAFIEGAITDQQDLDLKDLFETTQDTITAELANGKVNVYREAWYAGDATLTTGEGEVTCRFESKTVETIKVGS